MNPIAAPADDDPKERRALARFAAVQAVLQARQRGLSLTRALHEAAQQPWDGRFYSAETLENWLYRFERGHFAALHDQPRSDQGQKRALDPAVTEALLTLRRAHPEMTLHALTQELLRQGVLQPGTFSNSTLHRRLTEAGLDRRSLRAGAGRIGGPTKAFEFPLPNLLWMADCMHGPVLKLPDTPALRTYLFALLDDHSRLCVHGQFYKAERLECFLDALQRAVASLGELNTQFWRWLETHYHLRPHSALQNETPAQRFAKAGAHLRTLAPDADLERLFLMRRPRRVRMDATISLGGALWEVPPHLRAQIVTVLFDPVHWSRVEIWFRNQFVAHARRCNKHLNAQTRSSNDYQRFDDF